MTRLTKIDFPRFDGVKYKEWLGKAEQFFAIDNTPEEKKVGVASMHFDGEASTWHLALMQEDEEAEVLSSWWNYKCRLKECFEEIMDDPMAELKELRETESITKYHKQFEPISTRLKMSEEYLMSAYLAGLRLDTQNAYQDVSTTVNSTMLHLGKIVRESSSKTRREE